MGFWSYLNTSPSTWNPLCYRRKSKKSSPPAPPNTRANSTASTWPHSAGSASPTTTDPNTIPPHAIPCPVSSSSHPSSSSSSFSPSSGYPSILPATSSSNATQASPPSPSFNQTPGDHQHQQQHILFTAQSTTAAPHNSNHATHGLCDRIANTTRQSLSQHDYLKPPLHQLLRACQPRPCAAQQVRCPAVDPTSTTISGMQDLQHLLLKTHLDVTAKLSLLSTTLRPLLDFPSDNSIGGSGSSSNINRIRSREILLTRVEREAGLAERRNRRLRRHEEHVNRFLRWLRGNAGKGSGLGVGVGYDCCDDGDDIGRGRRAAIETARGKFMPFWREMVAELNLAGGRMGILVVELDRLEKERKRRM